MRGGAFQPPRIFDLHEHIAAINATKSRKRVSWPCEPNPFSPSVFFALQLLFYMPAGVMSRLALVPEAARHGFRHLSVVQMTCAALLLDG